MIWSIFTGAYPQRFLVVLVFSVIRHDPGNDENMLITLDARTVAEAYAAHVLDVYEHYRWQWKIQTPLRDKFADLKKKNPKAKAAELWEKTMAAVGESTIDRVWKNLELTGVWQDYYLQHKNLLAAETNFWSSFEAVGIATESSQLQRRSKRR
jgi:hypothetical protein